MKEKTLKHYFEGIITASDLLNDLVDVMSKQENVIEYHIEDMKDDFTVKPEHLLRLCDEVINGTISPELLQPIGFCLMASDRFTWDSDTTDGDIVSEFICDWSSPEINYPLNVKNVTNCRETQKCN